MQHIISSVTTSKPIMLIIGCRTKDGNKSEYIS